MLRLTAYMGLLRSHLFEVPDRLLRAADLVPAFVALPQVRSLRSLKSLMSLRSFAAKPNLNSRQFAMKVRCSVYGRGAKFCAPTISFHI